MNKNTAIFEEHEFEREPFPGLNFYYNHPYIANIMIAMDGSVVTRCAYETVEKRDTIAGYITTLINHIVQLYSVYDNF